MSRRQRLVYVHATAGVGLLMRASSKISFGRPRRALVSRVGVMWAAAAALLLGAPPSPARAIATAASGVALAGAKALSEATDGRGGSHAPEIEEIAVVVHPSLAAAHFDAATLEAVFTTAARLGPDGKPIIAFNFPPDDKLRIEFDRVVLRMTPEEVSHHWIDERVRGGQRPPRQIADPLLVMRLVGKLPGSIAYLPSRLVDKTVRVVARIRAGKMMPP